MEPTHLERALAAAPERPVASLAAAGEEYFLFRLGALTLGVRSRLVREVARRGPVTPLPRAPPFLLGVIGHRGEVLPLVDLLRFLGQGEARTSARSRVFVGVVGTSVVGFTADEVVGLRALEPGQVLPPPASGPRVQDFVAGVAALPGLGTVPLLALERVVESARQKVQAR